MTTAAQPSRSRVESGSFAVARAAADQAEAVQRTRAARTVACHSLDPGDCVELLSMLGLAEPRSRTATAVTTVTATRVPGEGEPGRPQTSGVWVL